MISAASPADNSLSSHFDDAFAALCESADVGAYAGAYEPQFAAPEGPLVDVLQGTPWASEMACATLSDADVAPQGRQAAQPALRAQLDNGGARLTPPSGGAEGLGALQRRRRSWSLRDISAKLLRPENIDERGPSVCGCGRAGFNAEEVTFHLKDDGTAKAGGVLHCDSAWLCPVCAPRKGKERLERMLEVFDLMRAYPDGQMVMCTTTVRHNKKNSLIDLKKVVQTASRKARQGKPWQKKVDRYRLVGVISAPEVTWSPRHGWHFHIHHAVLLHGTDAEAQEFGDWFIDRYMSYVSKLGYQALVKGQDVSCITDEKKLAEYISKGVNKNRDLAWEMAGQATKNARGEGLHPFEILEAAAGDKAMAQLWCEYAAAMKGTRSCVITKKIAETLDIEPDDDDQTPNEDLPDEDDVIGTLPSEVWNKVMNRFKGSTMLAILEDGGPEAWPEARKFAFHVAEIPLGEAGKPVPERAHAPSEEQIAKEALSEALQTKSKGRALKAVLDRHRGYAVGRGEVFIPPNVKTVLQLMAA